MDFKSYTKIRIPQATICTVQSTQTGGAQWRNLSTNKSQRAPAGQQLPPIRISIHGCRTGLNQGSSPRKQVSKEEDQGLQSQARTSDQNQRVEFFSGSVQLKETKSFQLTAGKKESIQASSPSNIIKMLDECDSKSDLWNNTAKFACQGSRFLCHNE